MKSTTIVTDVELNDVPLMPNEFIADETIENLARFKLNCVEDDDIIRYIYEYSQRLLSKAQTINSSKETAYAISLNDYSVIGPYWGMSHSIDIENMVRQFDNGDYVLIHNHPSGYTFSPRDLKVFVGKNSIRIMIILGNNGKVFILEKNDILTDQQKLEIRKAAYDYEEARISVDKCIEIIVSNSIHYQEY